MIINLLVSSDFLMKKKTTCYFDREIEKGRGGISPGIYSDELGFFLLKF